MVADVLKSTGIDKLVEMGEEEQKGALFLANLSNALLDSSNNAKIAGQNLKVVKVDVS